MTTETKQPKMKTTTAQFLAKSYAALNPDERLPFCQDTFDTFGNWLTRYQREPEKALATVNWCGKVTRALFHALGLKCPKTKGAMLEALKSDGGLYRCGQCEETFPASAIGSRPHDGERNADAVCPHCGSDEIEPASVGRYANTPHKTIAELCQIAQSRVSAGEAPAAVRADLIEGYSLGYQSANDRAIMEAIVARPARPARPAVTVATYPGPFPRARHAHRCRRCGKDRSVYCYKAQCTKLRDVETCQYCR